MTGDQARLFEVPAGRRRGRARRGLDDTLKALRTVGRLKDVDAALIALCRVAADELDAAAFDAEESRYTRGVLIARYHAVLTHLLARPDAADDDLLADLFASVGDAPAG